MSTSWHSYPAIYNLGHKAVEELLLDDVIVEEKVDGSQFSFGVFPASENYAGGLRIRSKGAEMLLDAPEKMFTKAVESVKERQHLLFPGWTYRAEYLAKPKHNSLAYERVPEGNLIIFDINTGEEEYLSYVEKAACAGQIGLECVPLLYEGKVSSIDQTRGFLERTSVLGGQKIEGFVIKNYHRFGRDKKALMGKFVSEAFKEIHAGEWKKENPTAGDILTRLVDRYRTPARWEKAVQHLRECDELEDSPRDIGKLFKEIPQDIEKECAEEMKEILWKWAWPKVARGCSAGLAEWYKEQLMKQQFETHSESLGDA